MHFICPACDIDYHYPSNLNKHLYTCEKYDEWIKTYVPPKTIDCDCGLKFIRNNDLIKHKKEHCKL